MSKCIKCGNFFINNPPDGEMCHICRIADLEAKLAESEFAHNSYLEKAEATISFLQQQFNEKGKLEEQLDELKQQLAEKDVELKDLRKMRERFLKLKEQKPNEFELLNLRDDVEGLLKELAEKEKQTEMIKNLKVDELSNAITVIVNHLAETIKNLDDVTLLDIAQRFNQDKISFAVEKLTQAIKNIKKCNYKDFGIIYQSDAIAVIDNQIKQLTHQHEDKGE